MSLNLTSNVCKGERSVAHAFWPDRSTGGEAALVGVAWFAVEVRVARLRGEESVNCATAVSGSGNCFGWLRVWTMFATGLALVQKRFERWWERYRGCDAEVRSGWKWALLELKAA